jgi:pimeloyl-ACP methyl ester carboxylesterase
VTAPDQTVRLAHEIHGPVDAPPMVLLHALGERRSSWAPVIQPFAERFRVFALDLRGHGESPWPGTYSYRLMRDDVVAALDEQGLDQVTLVGHSLGGVVALLVAMDHPQRVGRLVVEDVTPPFPRDRPVPERPGHELDFDWDVVPAIVGETNGGDPQAWEGLSAITAPTLLVGGGPESHVPQERIVEAAELVPKAEVVTIPAGHMVHNERPAEFADAVLTWLST